MAEDVLSVSSIRVRRHFPVKTCLETRTVVAQSSDQVLDGERILMCTFLLGVVDGRSLDPIGTNRLVPNG